MFADWLNASGLAVAKPMLTALALPPVPLLALAAWGAVRLRRQRRAGLSMVVVACLALWLTDCEGFAGWLSRAVLAPPPALDGGARVALKSRVEHGESIAIVVLGGGVQRAAPEYGAQDELTSASLARLRYGLWLGRETGAPVAFSGGAGWAVAEGAPVSEAKVAARTAQDEFGAPLRWTETTSRDTHENAQHTLQLLSAEGVRTIVLVTHDWHMPRALREFRNAAAQASGRVAVEPAPIGLAPSSLMQLLDWMPSGEGAQHVRVVLREALGLLLVH